MQTNVHIILILACLLMSSCGNLKNTSQPTPSETPTSIPSPTETFTPTITPPPTETFTPEPTNTPVPNFPHKIVDGKIVFDWSADLSTFPDITNWGNILLTKDIIQNWVNSPSSQPYVIPMPSKDTVCTIDWRQGHTGGNNPISQGLGLCGGCTKENSPVRVVKAARAFILFTGAGGEQLAFPIVLFVQRIYTPDDPKDYKDVVIASAAQSGDMTKLASFSNPSRNFSIDFGFTDKKLSDRAKYLPQTVARILQSIGLYDQATVDSALSEWKNAGYPTDAVDNLVFVGHAGSCINISP